MKKELENITVATNRKARHEYHILDTLEAGICLKGPEVKSLRAKQATLEHSFARVDDGEVFLHNVHITPYQQTAFESLDPSRTRKLLLNKTEIKRLSGQPKGVTLIPLEMYFNRRGFAKVRIAVCKGKQGPDKRQELRARAVRRELERDFKGKFKI
ncbi:MAG: SsrA-binding protein [Elusimicrobia bacterium RIFCSPLOWO2_12_FULL_59_9]|nr:MAG: SsrA-binding protein [Elusimicrobia bacterium RIFCSPLOWO2_12_FULL_59_9]